MAVGLQQTEALARADIAEGEQAVAELRKVADLYQQTERLANIGHWEWDEVANRCISCSEELARLCGYSVEEYISHSESVNGEIPFVHPDDQARYAAWTADYMKCPVRREWEYRLPECDGQVCDVREVVFPVFDRSKVHVRSFGFVQDISNSKIIAARLFEERADLERRVLDRTQELQTANDQLIESETRLRNAAKIAKLGYFKWDPVANRGIYCDQELANIFGIPVADCMMETLDEFLSRVHEDDIGDVMLHYETCNNQGVAADIEYRIVRPNGDVRHVHELSAPRKDKTGNVIQTFGTIQDVTERKYIGEELELVGKRLRELGANTREVLYVLSADWQRVVYVNKAYEDIWGHTCQAVIDDPRLWFDSLHPDDRGMILFELEKKISGEDLRPEFSDCRVIDSNGKARWLSTRTYPIRNNEGEIVNIAGIVDDITERKATIDALHHSQKMDAVGQLTGGVAHDFNNLLAVIIGNAELLQGRLAERDAAMLQDIISAGNRGAELTRRLLAFSRLQPLQPVITNVVKLVDDMGELLQRTLGSTISVKIISSCHDAQAFIDPGLLENAILNLSLNARDAMPDGGRLEIRVENVAPHERVPSSPAMVVDKGYLTVLVEDDGVGMDTEDLSRALEPYYTTKAVGDGTGLGLPMVYGFAKQSNGDLLIDSSPGAGTTVTICLPFLNN